jgi:hypothetical protein
MAKRRRFTPPTLSLVNVLLRILGLNLLAHIGSRLPSRTARTITASVLVAANLLPLVAVLTGSAGLGDVFVIYWFENVVVWFTTTIKILTARASDAAAGRNVTLLGNFLLAAFFTFHFGIFTFVHGVFSFTIARLTGGFTGEPKTWLIVLLAITASHVVSLGLNWFGQGERNAATVRKAMALPYPRMLVLHVSVLAAWFLLLGLPHVAADAVVPVAFLCGLKTAVDAWFHLRERFTLQPSTV